MNDANYSGHTEVLTLPVLVSVLEGLNQTQGLVHGAPHWQVVDGDLPQDALSINHKQAPEHRIMVAGSLCCHLWAVSFYLIFLDLKIRSRD